MKGSASRIGGMGRLLHSLRRLIKRVDRFGQDRACTREELRWATVLADDLERAALAAVDRRAAISAKTPGQTTPGTA